MELLKKCADFISANVETGDLQNYLIDMELLTRFECINLKDGNNRENFMKLLDVLADYKADMVYNVYDYIREKHPAVAYYIPKLLKGERMKEAIGPDKLVTMGLFANQLGFDIREMHVSVKMHWSVTSYTSLFQVRF